jgi:F0F1-type ATP synthase assembly protein I
MLWQEAVRATSLGWELAVPIFIGVLVGHFLDVYFETGYIFTVSFLFAGAFSGLYNVWRFADRMERRRRAHEQKQIQKQKEHPQ